MMDLDVIESSPAGTYPLNGLSDSSRVSHRFKPNSIKSGVATVATGASASRILLIKTIWGESTE